MRNAPLLLSAGLLALATAVAVATYSGSPVRGTDAAADSFSATRALATLKRLLSDERPHPLGSVEHDRVQSRLLAELRALGYAPEIETSFTCGDQGYCATVANIVVGLEGDAAPAVLLSAHYDSQVVTPGAADDGAGTAVLLEVARALAQSGGRPQSVVFLFTDGEELGLLGARAFLARHSRLSPPPTVLNIEARGSYGPALMFETGRQSQGLVREFARICPRPISTSLFTAVYETMPNSTDFSVFKDAGLPGLNFAFIGDLVHYHSPTDTLANLDAGSVQHAGDCALALTRALGESRGAAGDGEPIVFLHVLDRALLVWSSTAGKLWATAVGVLFAIALGALLRAGALPRAAWARGLVLFPLMILATAVAAQLLRSSLIAATGATAPWTAHPTAATIAFWATAAAGGTGFIAVSGRWAGFWGVWAGVWAWMTFTAIYLAWESPSESFVALLPAAAAALGVWVSGSVIRPGSTVLRIVAALPVIVLTAFMAAPLALACADAMTLGASGLLAVTIALGIAPLAPFIADAPRRTAFAITAALFAVAAGAAGTVVGKGAWSEARTRALNLMYHVDDGGTARWIADTRDGPAPKALRLAAGLQTNVDVPLIFGMQPPLLEVGPAPPHAAPVPEIELLGDEARGDGRSIEVRIRSLRGAPTIGLALRGDTKVEHVTINGTAVPAPSPAEQRAANGWRLYTVAGPPAAGVTIDLRVSSKEPIDAYVWDQSNDLPAAAAAILRARPADAVAKHGGDTWIVTRKVSL